MASQLAVRKVLGYAAVVTQPQLNIRNLAAYGVYAKTQTINFKDKTSQEIILDLINTESLIPLTLTQISMAAPQVNAAGGIPKDTSIELSVIGGIPYSGKTVLKYNRIAISRPFTNPTALGFTVTAATTIHALLASINTAHNVKLVPADVENNPVVANAKTVRLVAANTSYLYKPGASVSLGAVLPTLASAVTVRALSGFDPVTA